MNQSLVIVRPFDPHVHFRDGPIMGVVAPIVARYCQAAIAMPNTDPPILIGIQAHEYARRIEEASNDPNFRVFSAVKLTADTKPADVAEWQEYGIKLAKLYPTGVTNNSADGVVDPLSSSMLEVYREMENVGIILSIHGELPGVHRVVAEQQFLPIFRKIVDGCGSLKVVLEHISTAQAVDVVKGCGSNVAATITPQHLKMTAEDVFEPFGIGFHNYCRPTAKKPYDREKLREAAMSGSGEFFLGSDFAPHLELAKLAAEPAAGVCNYPAMLPFLATLFESYECMDQLEAFTSARAAEFYGVGLRDEQITLERKPFTVPKSIPLAGTKGSDPSQRIIPWLAGEKLAWSVKTA